MFDKKEISSALLRISMGLVFLYFGFNQISNPDNWANLIPNFLTNWILTPNNFVMLNGFMEITLGIFMIIGLYTRFASIILGLHLVGITIAMVFTPVGVRDFGLAIATLVVFIKGPDKYCLDRNFENRRA